MRGLRIELGRSRRRWQPTRRSARRWCWRARAAPGWATSTWWPTRLSAKGARGVDAPSLGELRSALSRHLPEYMLPAALVVLESMPLSPNGKADRKVLARIAPETLASASAERVAPRNALESFLAGLFAEECLESAAAEVGIEDGFFQLGGNSITGAILINRLQQELGEIVHVVTIFDHPTIAGLAALPGRRVPAGGGARGRNRRARPDRRGGRGAPGRPQTVVAEVARLVRRSSGRCRPRSRHCRESARGVRAVAAALGLDPAACDAGRPSGAVRAARSWSCSASIPSPSAATPSRGATPSAWRVCCGP